MKANVGRIDQMIRIGISLIFIYIGFIDRELISDPLSSNIIGIFGIIFLLIAASRFCPLYVITGVDTRHKKKS